MKRKPKRKLSNTADGIEVDLIRFFMFFPNGAEFWKPNDLSDQRALTHVFRLKNRL